MVQGGTQATRPPPDQAAGIPADHADRQAAQVWQQLAELHGVYHLAPKEAAQDLVVRLRPGGAKFWTTVAVLGVLSLAAGGAIVYKAVAGGPSQQEWGYTAATLAFLLSTAQAAPLLAITTRLAKGLWATPLQRAAEIFALSGLVTTPLFILLLLRLPPQGTRPSIWFGWPGAPLMWDGLAITLLSVTGLALLYVSSVPDLAAARDAAPGRPGRRLALGWRGSSRQWWALGTGLGALGIAYLALFVFVHLVLVSDLAISLVPGWHSSVIPPYHVLSGLQAGVATTILALAALRRFGKLGRYIGLDPFWGAAKILLALSLLFFYFTWAEFLTHWYGRTPRERWLLELLMFGPYFGPFVLSFVLNFLLPAGLLLVHSVRRSYTGPTLAAGLVILGNLVDRVRIYTAAWAVAEQSGQVAVFQEAQQPLIPPTPPPLLPDLSDLLVVLGTPSAVVLLYLLALRLVPAVSIWEYNRDRLVRLGRPYLKTAVAIIAKPT